MPPDPYEQVTLIDAVCDEFEAALREGKRLDLREELKRVSAEARPELFQHLLGIQQSILQSGDERPELSELLVEYPEFTQQILKVYGGDSSLVDTLQLDSSETGNLTEILRGIQPDQRYEIGEEVARGGMGAIRLAEDQALRRRLVVKTMLDPKAKANDVARFIEEAQITGQLDHPGIVPVHELGVDENGKPFYSMKFVHGRDLHTLLGGLRNGDDQILREFPLRQLLTIFGRVCDAVAFAHAHGVIHRDLKPANIRVGEFGEVMVMDWGLAKVIGRPDRPMETRQVSSVRGEDDSGAYHTMAGSVMGSPQYMSPEQAMGETAKLDERTDIYALGAILYEILTAQPAIEPHADVYQILESVSAGKIRNPILLNHAATLERREKLAHCPGNRIPEALAKVAMKALSLEPENRYEKVTDLQDEVESWMGGFATEAENAGLLRQIRLFVRRHKIASAAAGILAVVLTAATAVSLYQRGIAIEAKGEAETALANFQKSEREKTEQARESAPAYLKSALVLEQQGEFDDALTAVEGALRFDSDLTEGYQVRALLLARAGRWEEALESAKLLPEAANHRKLQETLESVIADPEINPMPELARLASESNMPSTSTDFLAQSAERFAAKYGDALPIWKAKLEQAWGFELGHYEFHVEKERGLSMFLDRGKKGHNSITSLEALRGIPLESLEIRSIPVSDLTPLRGMPLKHLVLNNTNIQSLDGLEDSPIQAISVERTGIFKEDFFNALRGKKFESLSFRTTGVSHIDTRLFSEIQSKQFWLKANVTSLAFVRHQENLQTIRIPAKVFDNDYRPVLECPTVETVQWASQLNRSTLPAWHQIANGSLPAAKKEISSLRELIQNEPGERTRELFDVMEFLIDRKTLGKANPAHYGSLPLLIVPESEEEMPQIVKLSDGRAFCIIMMALEQVDQKLILEAFDKLDVNLASIRSQEDQDQVFAMRHAEGSLLTGGFRTRQNPKWRWMDGSAWEFERFAVGEKNKVGDFPRQNYLLRNSGSATSGNFSTSRMLIQFPAEWLGR